MLAAVSSAFEASGCQVLGTATAGQAARTLADGAALGSSSTLASLVGRLDRGQLHLDERSVVILDEAGMTDDVGLARLTTHAQLAGAKLIVVGDHRQLGAVGPGGALAALVARHPDTVHHLSDNRRQVDPGEREALEALRDGDISRAVDWYAGHGRLRPSGDRVGALRAAVDGWAADTAAGAEVALLAWRRANVAELNSRARAWMADTGRLTGPELDVAGISYRAGDKVVALARDRNAGLVTSQRATISHVDVDTTTVMLRTTDGHQVALTAGQLGADRLGHAYATTVHRFQGATVERAHLYADGGGRELAYVAMSRARQASTAYVVADDLDQTREDLTRDWATRRTPTWAIDTGLPDTRKASSDPQSIDDRERVGSSPSATPTTGSSPTPPAPDSRPHRRKKPRRRVPPSTEPSNTSTSWPPSPVPTMPARSGTPPDGPTGKRHGSPRSNRPRPAAAGSSDAKPAATCPTPPPSQPTPRTGSQASSTPSATGSTSRSDTSRPWSKTSTSTLPLPSSTGR